MYCVEQKAITADYGFKDCARNISRESEKWNIQLTGGRYKDDQTKMWVTVAISSSEQYGGGTILGNSVSVTVDKTTAKGVSSEPYVKQRWDTGQDNAANNGTRAVNVRLSPPKGNAWHDAGGTGIMADRLQWNLFSYDNKYTCFSKSEYHSGTNRSIYNSIVIPIYTQCYHVHPNHPYFGKTKWQVLRDEGNATNSASYRIWQMCCKKNSAYAIYGHIPQNWGGTIQVQAYTYAQYADQTLYNGPSNYRGCYIYVKGASTNTWRESQWEGWNVNEDYRVATIPVIQNVSARPTNGNPITGKSVNE